MRLILAFLLMFATAAPTLAQSDQAERETLARELVEMTTAESVMTPMIDAMWPNIEMQITAGGEVDPQILASLKEVLIAELRVAMSNVMDDFVASYAGSFTLPELEAILTFYRSAPGTKLINVQPVIMQELLPKLTAELQQTIPGAVQRVVEEAERQGLDATP